MATTSSSHPSHSSSSSKPSAGLGRSVSDNTTSNTPSSAPAPRHTQRSASHTSSRATAPSESHSSSSDKQSTKYSKYSIHSTSDESSYYSPRSHTSQLSENSSVHSSETDRTERSAYYSVHSLRSPVNSPRLGESQTKYSKYSIHSLSSQSSTTLPKSQPQTQAPTDPPFLSLDGVLAGERDPERTRPAVVPRSAPQTVVAQPTSAPKPLPILPKAQAQTHPSSSSQSSVPLSTPQKIQPQSRPEIRPPQSSVSGTTVRDREQPPPALSRSSSQRPATQPASSSSKPSSTLSRTQTQRPLDPPLSSDSVTRNREQPLPVSPPRSSSQRTVVQLSSSSSNPSSTSTKAQTRVPSDILSLPLKGASRDTEHLRPVAHSRSSPQRSVTQPTTSSSRSSSTASKAQSRTPPHPTSSPSTDSAGSDKDRIRPAAPPRSLPQRTLTQPTASLPQSSSTLPKTQPRASPDPTSSSSSGSTGGDRDRTRPVALSRSSSQRVAPQSAPSASSRRPLPAEAPPLSSQTRSNTSRENTRLVPDTHLKPHVVVVPSVQSSSGDKPRLTSTSKSHTSTQESRVPPSHTHSHPTQPPVVTPPSLSPLPASNCSPSREPTKVVQPTPQRISPQSSSNQSTSSSSSATMPPATKSRLNPWRSSSQTSSSQASGSLTAVSSSNSNEQSSKPRPIPSRSTSQAKSSTPPPPPITRSPSTPPMSPVSQPVPPRNVPLRSSSQTVVPPGQDPLTSNTENDPPSEPKVNVIPRAKVYALEQFAKLGRKRKDQDSGSETSSDRSASKKKKPEFPPSSWFQDPSSSSSATAAPSSETDSGGGSGPPPSMSSKPVTSMRPPGQHVRRASEPAVEHMHVQGFTTPMKSSSHFVSAADNEDAVAGDETPPADVATPRRVASPPGTPKGQENAGPEPANLARRIQALLGSLPSLSTATPTESEDTPTQDSLFPATPIASTAQRSSPPTTPPRSSTPKPHSPIPPAPITDYRLISMLSNGSIMNGSMEKGRQSVFSLLDRLRSPAPSRPTSMASSAGIAPPSVENYEDDMDDNESIMLYAPLEPTEDSEVELARSDIMSVCDDGEEVFERERPSQRISMLMLEDGAAFDPWSSPRNSRVSMASVSTRGGDAFVPEASGTADEHEQGRSPTDGDEAPGTETNGAGEGDKGEETQSGPIKRWFDSWKGKPPPKEEDADPAQAPPVPFPVLERPVKTRVIWLPSPEKISFQATWWGYRLYLPPPVLDVLNNKRLEAAKRAAIITTALQWLFNSVPVAIIPIQFRAGLFLAQQIVPYLGYIGGFLAWSWGSIKAFDKGEGVVLTATWLLPVALIPGTWETPADARPPSGSLTATEDEPSCDHAVAGPSNTTP